VASIERKSATRRGTTMALAAFKPAVITMRDARVTNSLTPLPVFGGDVKLASLD
tara:strand:- start:2444 stop:2605 length:162 start_codon:yes stop_codon:yes gene_type:complete